MNDVKPIYHISGRTKLLAFKTGERGNYINDFINVDGLRHVYKSEDIPTEAAHPLYTAFGGYDKEDTMGNKEFVRLLGGQFLYKTDGAYYLYDFSEFQDKEPAEYHRALTGHGYRLDATGWKCDRCKEGGR